MKLPSNPLRKGLGNPTSVMKWTWRHVCKHGFERCVSRVRRPRYLFSHEWDLAIVLDACRYDVGSAVAAEYDLPEPERVYSPAWTSDAWLRRTFGRATDEQLAETAYTTANQHSADCVPTADLAHCDEVWTYAWDEELGTVPPRPVTDRTIAAAREGVADRYVAHYMQPHLPPVAEDVDWASGIDVEANEWRRGNPWDRVRNGVLDGREVASAYRQNVRPVMEEVRLLLENVDADVAVVTADHGNFLGEGGRWGHHGHYHYQRAVRDVPWWEVSATDTRSHQPAEYELEQSTARGAQLRALGYR